MTYSGYNTYMFWACGSFGIQDNIQWV
jgi:hypothetical protein